jgi:hypothetical protein
LQARKVVRRKLSAALIAIVAFACATTPSAGLAAPEIDAGDAAAAARIDAVCAASVDRALKEEPQVFARIYGSDERGEWRLASATILHRIDVDPNIYSEVAKAWQIDGRVVLVNIEARSLELRANSTYCYRHSGTLARVMENSAGAQVRDEESRYLDDRGHVVATHSKFFSIYPRPGRTLSPDLRPSTPSLYLTVQGLPFYSMLEPVRG